MFTVYKHTSPSGKIYIGITSVLPSIRWRNGYVRHPYFYKAIQKYGWNNIKHEILFTELTENEAKAKEKELIEYYNSNNRKFGYNLTKGGEGSLGRIASKETIKKMSEATKLSYKKSPEIIEKIRKSALARPKESYLRGEKHQNYGKPMPWATGANHYKARAVICITTGEKFSTITEAFKKTGILKESIGQCCRGKNKTAGKLKWKYIEN